MRENLIGYLLNALDPAEHAMVEAHLNRDPELKRELELLSRSLEPLAADQGHCDPPLGLALRTCEFVAVQSKVQLPPRPVTTIPSRWSMGDLAVAAGVFLAATLLFWPAMNQSRFAARLRGCQNNLRQLGMSMGTYSEMFPGQFPALQIENSRANRAGIYAVILRDQGLIPQTHILICPASEMAEERDNFNVPTYQEVMLARAQQLAAMQRRMGGSYGYSLGFYHQGRYNSPTNKGRSTHALMADAPNAKAAHHASMNHGGCGQNVLFEDLHVKFMTTCRAYGCNNDHIFENEEGQPYAGLHEDDVVLGASDAMPMIRPVHDEAELVPMP